MNLNQSTRDNTLKKSEYNGKIALALIKSSEEAALTAKHTPIRYYSLKSIFRELYESLYLFSEALGHIKGYQLSSHEEIASFFSEILNEKIISRRFEYYTRLRSQIDYANNPPKRIIEKSLKEIPIINQYLRKYIFP